MDFAVRPNVRGWRLETDRAIPRQPTGCSGEGWKSGSQQCVVTPFFVPVPAISGLRAASLLPRAKRRAEDGQQRQPLAKSLFSSCSRQSSWSSSQSACGCASAPQANEQARTSQAGFGTWRHCTTVFGRGRSHCAAFKGGEPAHHALASACCVFRVDSLRFPASTIYRGPIASLFVHIMG